uniref:Ookinete surface protein P28 n=1 Tax=Plasmodium hylobati TaxID=77520 RepID=A0A1B0WVP7_PLAHY|nr:ookinete surface protein P28 [Plasmodium hylobati]
MNTYHSILFVLALVLALNYTIAQITVDTECKNGYLVQMSNHFECKCNDGFVLENDRGCEPRRDCASPGAINQSCGDYAVCTGTRVNGQERAPRCTCKTGYTPLVNVCVRTMCYRLECGKGKCVKDPNSATNAFCSCNIGITLDQFGKCTKPGDTQCALKCQANEECKLTQNYYKCVAKESGGEGSGGEGSGGEGSGGEGSGGEGSGGEGSGGEGSGGATGAAYGLMNASSVISILVVFALFMMSLV